MKKLLTAAALAATFATPADADDWLTGYSYACKREDLLNELGRALEYSDYDRRDRLIGAKRCYLINNAAEVTVLFESGDKTFFRARSGGRAKLWTWSKNIRSE